MPPISILIKPVSSLCNLRCQYCFYHSTAGQRAVGDYGIMPISLLETIVAKALDYADGACTFAFQGGEPTLAGLDFYKALLQLLKRHNHKGVKIHNAIQTNGTALDGAWAAFLAENHFLVGISIDGPKAIHDAHRTDECGRGSFRAAMNAARLLEAHGAAYNVLTVVNSLVARHPEKVYRFLQQSGFRYLQFIQCLDPLGEAPGGHPYSLTPERYGRFLMTVFDLWYRDLLANRYTSVRTFDNFVSMAAGHPPESCGMAGRCTCYFVAESDGGIYPCDFYVLDEWRLGSIKEKSFAQLLQTDNAKRFVSESVYVHPHCASCPHYALCRGGCRRTREPFVDGRPDLNRYCQAYRAFFEYAGERIYALAHRLSKAR